MMSTGKWRSKEETASALQPPLPRDCVLTKCQRGQNSVKECSMCGDVGFQEELFQCNSCFFRFQHRYCSSLYPKLECDEHLRCEWCIHDSNFKALHEASANKPPESLGSRLDNRRADLLIDGPTDDQYLIRATETLLQINSKSLCIKKTQRKSTEGYKRSSSSELIERSDYKWGAGRGRSELSGSLHLENKSDNHFTLQRWPRRITNAKLQTPNSAKASGRRYKLLADVLC
eukprot:Gb_02087 [translate_table: standard]